MRLPLGKGRRAAARIPGVIDTPATSCIRRRSPVDALKPLISTFCPGEGIVLDPFAGSGSTLVAAKQLSRRYLGFEIDAQHHRTATARLDEMSAAA